MDRTEEQYVVLRPVVKIFHNSSNLFTIMKCRVKETNIDYKEKDIIITGNYPVLETDIDYRVFGRIIQHPKYGKQLQVDRFEKELPSTKEGLVHYLSSDLFPGIGQKTAERVVEKLGSDAIGRIIENPNVLDGITGITEKRKETLVDVLRENLGLERTLVQLASWDFGPQLAMKIYQVYQEETLDKIKENPYRLIEDVKGIGFQRADKLGRHLGIEETSIERLRAAIIHVIDSLVQREGHVFVEWPDVKQEAKELLEKSAPTIIDEEDLELALASAIVEEAIVKEEERLYLPSLYYSEVGAVEALKRLLETPLEEKFPLAELKKAIGAVEDELDVTYAPTQVEAIERAINEPMMILTGGPGTGKTTVIRGIVETYREMHGISLDPADYDGEEHTFPLALAAPTGRAAKRMAESTGLPAMTIHRLLGFTGEDDEDDFDSRELDARLVIIDEMSMVDTWLFYQLMKAIPHDSQVLFVGDDDQLPSVGPGQVLSDLLRSGVIPTVQLTDVYRQSEGSSIVELAHEMKQGELKTNILQKASDRSFIPAGEHQVVEVVDQVVSRALEKGFSIHDIQVLVPMYRGPAGIDAMNERIQASINPPAPGRKEITYGQTVYRVGDKVLQLVNQPEANVFNGDMGEIVAIFEPNENTEKKHLVVVDFDGIEVTYERQDLNQITLAYCCSIHKAQGSEFSMVIMPVVRSYYHMLRKNLLYTGITRASDYLILCGDPEKFTEGMYRTDDMKRKTSLIPRLLHALDNEKYEAFVATHEERETTEREKAPIKEQLPEESFLPEETVKEESVLTETNMFQIDPMIGMDGVRPEQFEVDEDN